MKRRALTVSMCLLVGAILTACKGPSQAELDAQATEIAADTLAAQTAEAPTLTNTPIPTNTPTHTPTSTLTPTPTDMPTPTNTPTPLPPTHTPTPTPTDTPTPTPTHTPTPTPSPTMDADPTVYDNFNNPANEGGYNKDLWEPSWWPLAGQFAQQDGVMMITQWGGPTVATDVVTRRYNGISLDRPTFFEARLMLSPDANTGNVHLDLFTKLSPNEPWYSECQLNQDGEQSIQCLEGIPDGASWPYRYDSEVIPVQSGSWHTVRMEVDPATMTFSYFVDGRFVGSHTSHHADRLKKARFRLEIGVYAGSAAGSADVLTGYVDDVRIGQPGQ